MTQADGSSNRRPGASPEAFGRLERQMWVGGRREAKPQGIPRRPEGSPPLSFNQQQLWFLDQLTPVNAAYNIPLAMRLEGPLDVATLGRAIGEIVRRHESLRTTFAVEEGRPVQVIHPFAPLELPVIALDDAPGGEGARRVEQAVNEEAQRPFELERGPLFRVKLLRLAENDHVLALTMHHIVSDGWSIGVFSRELSALYPAFLAGKPSPLPELPVQYADFAHWQREWLAGETFKAQVAWWKEQLAGAPPKLDLPADRPRPLVLTFAGAAQQWFLPATLSRELKALARREGATLFIALLAAFDVLLCRYTGQTDILVGSPFANRNRSELEQLIGFFAGPVILRSDLSGDPTFRELLGRVRAVTLNAFDHQDVPFGQLVDTLQPVKDQSRAPLFQAMFILQSASMDLPTIAGLNLTLVPEETGTAKVDLTLSMSETEDGLGAVLEYSTDLFDGVTIARLFEHFRILLEGAVADPDRRISELPLLGPAERRRVVVEWNDTARAYVRQCVHQRFEAQVARAPDAVAVSFAGQGLTYGELNRRANQLAHHLRRLGVGPETLVGICVERSLEMVAGVLGVLKAGGAYVPLDPTYPKERLAFMIEDTRSAVLLTQERLAAGLAGCGATVVCLDRDWGAIARESAENLQNATDPGNLAYVIFTSGSTGRPKGVMVTHDNLQNACTAYETAYRLSSVATCHIQMASMSFDVFAGDLVRALLSGARLVICPHELLLAPDGLYDLMRRERVDAGDFVPVVLSTLVDHVKEVGGALDFMRVLVVGADVWRGGEHRRALGLCGPKTRLFNTYGVSEATIDSTYFETGAIECPDGAIAPIGRPFANTQLFVLDQCLEPVPIGVYGELYIGGGRLARGYLGRPELTAERFIPDPWSDEPGARLYRTGDMARHLPDGNVEFLGRIDDQVKIRGFRIEPGEVEAVLGEHPALQKTVVVAREDAPGDKRLVAYVVPAAGAAPAPSELRAFLLDRLPEYMVPAAFMVLDALPLLPNGKVNRRALPAPEKTRSEPEATFVAPRTSVEEVLAVEIFAKVLGVERVGANDNFFDMGGNSLQATQLMSKVRGAFHVDIPLRTIFAAPTVAALARAIDLARQDATAVASMAAVAHDLDADSVLDDDIRPDGPYQPDSAAASAPRHVFLTGGTGFVGSFMLRELLDRTGAHVHCLVRAPSDAAAMDRLRGSLERYLIWDESLRSRIVPIAGDLAQPLLGLSAARFEELCATMDVIYHCGAWVNYVLPYQVLKPATVGGTREVLRLACRGKVKPVHSTSTTAVFAPPADETAVLTIREDSDLPPPGWLTIGYSQSKWVVEKLLQAARARGLPVCIYRLGRVFGDSRTGACQTGDFMWLLIKGSIQLGGVPELGLEQNLVPADYVAKVVVHLSRRPGTLGRVFHVYIPKATTLDEVMDFARSLGFKVDTMPYQEWAAGLESDRSQDNALYPMLPIFGGPSVGVLKFECPSTLEALKDAPFTYPAVDEALLSKYFTYFMRTGYFATPGRGPGKP